MAQDSKWVRIGPATISVAAWESAPGAATLSYREVGHTSAPSEFAAASENVDVESEQAIGIVASRMTKQTMDIVIPMLEISAENLQLAFGQAAAQVTGTNYNKTIAVIDPSTAVGDQYKVFKFEETGGPGTNGAIVWNFWKCRIKNMDSISIGKGVPQVIKLTLTVLRDDSNTTANGYYFKRVVS